MAQDAVAFVKDVYGAYGRGDLDTVLGHLDPEVEWTVHGRPGDHPAIGEWRGREGAASFFRTVSETLDFTLHQPEAFYGDGDKVFVLGRFDLVDKATGAPASWKRYVATTCGPLKSKSTFMPACVSRAAI